MCDVAALLILRQLREQEREIRMLAMVAALGGGKVDPPEWGAAETWFEDWLSGRHDAAVDPVDEAYREELVALGLRR